MTNKNQGEGDKESAKKFNEAQTKFAKSGKVEKAAQEAKKSLDAEPADIRGAGRQDKSGGKR